jgi:hypothetical protein
MQREEVSPDLSQRAFEFFFWFSRFEFALKENNLLQSHKVGADADPGWSEFIQKAQGNYVTSENAKRLLALAPKKQTVGPGSSLTWQATTFPAGASELDKVVRLLKVARNNLFHGGKHGGDSWDDPKRTDELLTVGTALLHELAKVGGFEGDFKRYY